MKGKTIFLLFINFLLITSLVFSHGFSYQTLEVSNNSLCPRESGLFKDKVKNTDTTARAYSASLSGSAAAWSTIFPTSFILAAGEEKEVFTYTTPRTDTQAGSYELKVNFASGSDVHSIMHIVVVKSCYGVDLRADKELVSVCPGEIAKYEISVSNNGEYAETYNLAAEGQIKDRINLGDKKLILNKGEAKKVIVFVNTPGNAGDYGFSVTADAVSGKSKNSLSLNLNVKGCFDFKFGVQSEKTSYEVCDRTATTVQFRIENQGTTWNEYELMVDGPSWVRLSRNALGLMPNEVRIVELYITPDFGIEGDFPIRLELVPKKGNLKASSSVDVKVKKCSGVDLELKGTEFKACKGVATDFDVTVKNTGELEKVFQAGLDAPAWVSFNTVPQFSLKAGDEKNLVIRALPTGDVEEEDYKVKVGVKAGDASSVIANDQEEFQLEVVDIANCYKPGLDTEYTDAVIYYDSSVPIPVTITNTGNRKADYSLFLTGNSVNFVRLNPASTSLDPGKSETVYLYVAPDVNVQVGEYNAILTVNLQGGQLLASKEFKFEITSDRSRATNIADTSNATSSRDNGLDDQDGRFKEFVFANKVPLIVGIIIVLLIALSFVLGWHKSFIEFFEEDYEEEPVEKKKKKKSSENKIKGKVEEE